MTHSNSESKGLRMHLQKSCSATLPEFRLGVSATAQFTVTAMVVDAARAPLEPVTVTM